MQKRLCIIDIETNKLVNPDKLWLVGVKDVTNNTTRIFHGEDTKSISEYFTNYTHFIGHNIIGFDWPVLHSFHLVGDIQNHQLIDTLIISRLLNFNIEGGHSLEAWGERLNQPKLPSPNFSEYSPYMEEYLRADLETTYKLYKTFEKYLDSATWKSAIELEHQVAFICQDMHNNGFAFNKEKAESIYKEIDNKIEILDKEILEAFPPLYKPIKEITPKATKHGTLSRIHFKWKTDGDLSSFSAEAPFTLIESVPFNPSSPSQIVERLNKAGWSPIDKTKGHIKAEKEKSPDLPHFREFGWKVNETNLETLPMTAPEAARKLATRILLAARRSVLTEWFSALQEAPRGSQRHSRIHGNFNGIGAWTHRMSHSNPNQGNIPVRKKMYSTELRSLWCVDDDRYLIGVDADQIQLRIFAHYIQEEEFTKALVSGDKKQGTDVHTLNKLALGDICQSRDDSKTFIYAFLLGAGLVKISQILKCSLDEAEEGLYNFNKKYTGLRYLKKEIIPVDAKRGYFEGLDGRLVKVESMHKVLAGYLQNGESIIMKKANTIWREQLDKLKLPYKQVNFVHDEWQVETLKDKDLALQIAKIMVESISTAGEIYNTKCPMLGSLLNKDNNIAIGSNWSETH